MATKKYLDYAGLKRVLAKLLPGARKIWHGTLAEWEALSATEKAKYDQAEVIDEYTGVPVVVDKVESGNLNPVTSNAVAGVITGLTPVDVVEEGNMNPVTSNAVAKESKVIPVSGYSTPGKASGYETVTRTGNVVMIDFTTLKANAQKVLTGLPKPVNMAHCLLFDFANLYPQVSYISADGEFFVPSSAVGVELYGQLVYFTNEA